MSQSDICTSIFVQTVSKLPFLIQNLYLRIVAVRDGMSDNVELGGGYRSGGPVSPNPRVTQLGTVISPQIFEMAWKSNSLELIAKDIEEAYTLTSGQEQ